MDTPVPERLLSKFFQSATDALSSLQHPTDGDAPPLSISDCRRVLLETQRGCLERIVEESHEAGVSLEQVQRCLANLKHDATASQDIQKARTGMEDAARRCLCRLALYSECLKMKDSNTSRNLQTDGPIDRSRLLEFIALNQTAITLSLVRRYLKDGGKLFEDLPQAPVDDGQSENLMNDGAPPLVRIQSRMELLQRMLARATGLLPSLVTTELQRVVEDGQDQEFLLQFRAFVVSMQQTMAECRPLNDIAEGGVTRVISVTHKTIDNPDASSSVPPVEQTMESNRIHQLRMASRATALQRQILTDLLQMDVGDRDVTLERAKLAHDAFLALSPLERLQKVQGGALDAETQRMMLIHQTWQQHLASSGGVLIQSE